MFDFRDVQASSKSEQIRAWAVEQAIDYHREVGMPYQDLIALSKMIEDFVEHGK